MIVLCASPASAGSAGNGSGGGGAVGETYQENLLWSASVSATLLSTSNTPVKGTPPPPPSASYIRVFGVSEGATAGFDRDLDVAAPPGPLQESLDVFFPCGHEVVTRLAADIRPDAGSNTWDLRLTVPPASKVDVSWDLRGVPAGKALTLNYGNGDIDMRKQASVSFESGTYSLSITTNKSASAKTSGSGGSGGSGGGRGGGSPEPQSNVEAKELSQRFITNGQPVRFEFSNEATCVGYVEFEGKKSFGKATSIVEMLKGKSTLTQEGPGEEVYRYLNIWVGTGGFSTSENMEKPIIGFRVEKAWLEKFDIVEASIRLWRYHGETWTPLATKKVEEDDRYVYFEAETPGFSPFAITGVSEKDFEAGDFEKGNPEVEDSSSDLIYAEPLSTGNGTDSKSPGNIPLRKVPGLGIFPVSGLFACASLICRRICGRL